MALDVFDFPYHLVPAEKNPITGGNVQFGSNWVFTAPSADPDQREFTLDFAGMKYYTDEDGLADATIEPQRNMLALLNFYYAHKLATSFQYTHPVHGLMEVRFKEPVSAPKGVKGGDGVVQDFSLTFIEIP